MQYVLHAYVAHIAHIATYMHDGIRVNDHSTLPLREMMMPNREKSWPNGDAISFSFRIKYLLFFTLAQPKATDAPTVTTLFYIFGCQRTKTFFFSFFLILDQKLWHIRTNFDFKEKKENILVVPVESFAGMSFILIHLALT